MAIRKASALPKSPPSYLTVEEAAQKSGLSVATIRRRCSSGEIEAVKVGSQWLVPPTAVSDSSTSRKRKPQTVAPGYDLQAALQHVRATDLSELWVPDVLRFRDIVDNPKVLLEEAQDRLDRLAFRPAIRLSVPKTPYSSRPAVLLDLPDRIAFQAVVATIAPAADETLLPTVYSARRSRGSKYFLEHGPSRWVRFKSEVRAAADGLPTAWIAATDISAYFEHILHDRLFEELVHLGVAGHPLRALRIMLSKWALVPGMGLPQGPNASRVLGNFYLAQVDAAMVDARHSYFRFMDDVRIVAGSKERAVQGVRDFEGLCRQRGLIVSSAKTSVSGHDPGADEDEDPDLDEAAYFFDHGSVTRSRPVLKKILRGALGENSINVRRARFSIWRLARIRERDVLPNLMRKMELLAPVASAVAAYLTHFISRGSVERGLAQFLEDPSRSYSPFLRAWVYAAILERSSITERLRILAESDSRDRNNPGFLRAIAVCVLAKARVPRDLSWIKTEIEHEHDPAMLRAYLVALTFGGSLDRATISMTASTNPALQALGSWLKSRKSLPSLVYPDQEIRL